MNSKPIETPSEAFKRAAQMEKAAKTAMVLARSGYTPREVETHFTDMSWKLAGVLAHVKECTSPESRKLVIDLMTHAESCEIDTALTSQS